MSKLMQGVPCKNFAYQKCKYLQAKALKRIERKNNKSKNLINHSKIYIKEGKAEQKKMGVTKTFKNNKSGNVWVKNRSKKASESSTILKPY